MIVICFCFQAEDGIRDLVRSRGLGDVYKRQQQGLAVGPAVAVLHGLLEVQYALVQFAPAGVLPLSLIHI